MALSVLDCISVIVFLWRAFLFFIIIILVQRNGLAKASLLPEINRCQIRLFYESAVGKEMILLKDVIFIF